MDEETKNPGATQEAPLASSGGVIGAVAKL